MLDDARRGPTSTESASGGTNAIFLTSCEPVIQKETIDFTRGLGFHSRTQESRHIRKAREHYLILRIRFDK